MSWLIGTGIKLRTSEFHFLLISFKILPQIISILSPLPYLDSRVLKARAASPSG